MMDALQVKKIFDRLNSKLSRQRRQCDAVDSWLRPELDAGFEVPRLATREHRALRDLSRTPWLRLVVDNCVQAMYVDNVVGEDGRIDELWGAVECESYAVSADLEPPGDDLVRALVCGCVQYGVR